MPNAEPVPAGAPFPAEADGPARRPEAAAPVPAPAIGLLDRLRIQTWALFIIAFGTLVAVLVAGRFILMSLVLAAMVFGLTLGIIERISRIRLGGYGLPRWLSYTVAFLLITVGLVGAAIFVVSQINGLIVAMVAYSEVATLAIAQLFGWIGEGATAEVLSAIRSVNIASYLWALAAQGSTLLSVAVMTSMFVGFLFAEQLHFRPKLRALYASPAGAARAERIAAGIIWRVNRYLLVKTGVSAAVGLIVFATMYGFGLQFAAVIAVLSFVLNYIPNLGTLVASALAILAAFIQQPGWEVMIAFSAIIGAVQFLSGNVFEPMLMGRSLALSTFGIVIALTFWGSVWGVMGMFLAVPINVALLVLFANIAPLRPLAVLLSRDGDLGEETAPR